MFLLDTTTNNNTSNGGYKHSKTRDPLCLIPVMHFIDIEVPRKEVNNHIYLHLSLIASPFGTSRGQHSVTYRKI